MADGFERQHEADERQHVPPVEGALGEWLAEESAERVRHVRWVRRNVRRLFFGVLVALLGMAVALAFAISAQKKQGESQDALAHATRAVTSASCESGNDLRLALTKILSGFASLGPVRDPAAQKAYAQGFALLTPVDCAARTDRIPAP